MQTLDPTVAVPQFPEGTWYKSSRSNPNGGDCVEVNMALVGDEVVGVRDSKQRQRPTAVFAFPSQNWGIFVTGARAGKFDL